VELIVRDTGSGMDPETLEKAQRPFYTGKADSGGTGLGLANIADIVRERDGVLRVRSEEGKGTSVHVFWCAAQRPSRGRLRESGPKPMASTAVRRVLLVEDEATLEVLLSRMLSRHGYEVHSARSPREALVTHRALLGEGKPIDILITDLMLERVDGAALATEIERDRPNLPVIFVSGYSDALSRLSHTGERVARLAKPFAPADLLHLMERLLAPLPEALVEKPAAVARPVRR